ncbi:MAG: Leucine-responsive regulatory protein [Burkholderia lata]|uniref:Leucine-responsive regulatory protein n=1 Tax=Burkholderia lata (strain ATCC 17760 / DSM 23089 / LMG 22485 / NCIMB 9086 / R18194 / 383) TaxID=482957 RepID=A0A833UKF2_BURL3|nr:Lrp/AsnC family transcriptional regulator [Burkholderia lata]KAF1036143.1 MAG: Leucine-responsive regulatory protein [Burkholderia lata]
MLNIDCLDHKLIALLCEDGRASTATLARVLDLSRTTVQSRIDRLERRGVIVGYGARLSAEYEHDLVKALVMIMALPKLSGRVQSSLLDISEVRTIHSVSGQLDLIVLIVAQSVEKLNGLIDRIGGLDGVERTTTAIVLSTIADR